MFNIFTISLQSQYMALYIFQYEYKLPLQHYGRERSLIHTFPAMLSFLLFFSPPGKPVQLLREPLSAAEQDQAMFPREELFTIKETASTQTWDIIHKDGGKCAMVFKSNLLCLKKGVRLSTILTDPISCFSFV